MKKYLLNKDTESINEKILSELQNALRQSDSSFNGSIYASLCCLHLISVEGNDKFLVKNRKNVLDIIAKYKKHYTKDVKQVLGQFSSDDLIQFILYSEFYYQRKNGIATPLSIAKLASRILNVQENDKVLDLCSGLGTFASVLYQENECFTYEGIDLSYTCNEIAEIRCSIMGIDSSIILGDVLSMPKTSKVDKIFTQPPFRISSSGSKDEIKELANKLKLDESILGIGDLDWAFVAEAIYQLDDDGKGIVIIPKSDVAVNRYQSFFSWLVDNTYLDSVINLPTNLINGFSMPICILVLSKNNDTINFVDASEIYHNKRAALKYLTEEDIDKIIAGIGNNTEWSTVKSINDVASENYSINPTTYLQYVPRFDNGKSFKSVVKKLSRGAQIQKKDFELMKSDGKTEYQYLLISDIENGRVTLDGKKQYLKDIPENLTKYCITSNSLVISKLGLSGFKTAVVEVPEGKNILANGNMYVVELDHNEVNPYYLQAFFMSGDGQALLRSIASDTQISSISKGSLMDMQVPIPAIDKQNAIANKYLATLDEYVLLERKLKRVEEQLVNIYSEEE